jgi:hypothetical protein
MQNFLEVYLKTNAPSRDYVGALHNICYNGARGTTLDRSQFSRVDQILRERTDEYAEKLPDGPPRYGDLEIPFEPYIDESEFARVAPKPIPGGTLNEKDTKAALKKAHAAPTNRVTAAFAKKSPWKEFIDDRTGTPYYWNEETNESSWEMPAELKYAAVNAASRV